MHPFPKVARMEGDRIFLLLCYNSGSNMRRQYTATFIFLSIPSIAIVSVIGWTSLVMHIASPGFPQSALRLLFYRAVASSHSERALNGGKREGQSSAHKKQSGRKRQSTGGTGAAGVDVVGGDTGGAGDLSVAGIVGAILEFPLGCEGLAPLVAATASADAMRNLHKQLTFQAREAITEAKKVRQIQFVFYTLRNCQSFPRVECKMRYEDAVILSQHSASAGRCCGRRF